MITQPEPTPLSDNDFLLSFLAGSLSASDFDHRGHLRAAWLILGRQPRDQAIETICAGILQIATRLGAHSKFHRTLTEALVRIMDARRRQARDQDWPDFLAKNQDLLHNATQVLSRHYSDPLLQSTPARTMFVVPDRERLPE
ncbi:hypothetical protein C7S18_08170 [Ahniella affigens]|uniref:Uncharacterized protein n=1 Tax=Ahniella affigens TaxID=2021234 RepID=A0A2P1PQQ5_9GAMM|nr:hypothetical protein [Ahniella affigens]AVP97169.1 hypothetical protein C7S18_08170 [Ahniella affigens]